jgi:hypothetical protein
MPLERHTANPGLSAKIAQMALPLSPLVQITTGAIHPSFPSTLLAYWCLTSDQLDSLAHFYHQRTPSQWTSQYPKTMGWRRGLTLGEKRRKFGKFIGLRGCETPRTPEGRVGRRGSRDRRESALSRALKQRTEEQILEECRRRAEEEEMLMRKARGFY